MHNASSVPVPVLCFGLVTSTPLPPPHRTFLPRVLSPRDPKSTERGRRWEKRRRVQERRDDPPDLHRNPPAFPPLQSADSGAEAAMGSGSLLKVLAKNFDVLAGSVSLPVSALVPVLHDFFPGLSSSRTSLLVPRRFQQRSDAAARFRALRRVRHCWNADALRRS